VDDVRVLDVAERAKLVLEEQERVGREGRQQLERDARVVLAVDGLVHLAHPAAADAAHDPEPLGPRELGFAGGSSVQRAPPIAESRPA